VIRLALRVRRADAEVVLAELLELVPEGCEERDLGDEVEYALYGAPGELPALPELRAVIGGALVDVSTEEIPDDWYDGWNEFHRPIVVGDRLRVRPPWEAAVDDGKVFIGSLGGNLLAFPRDPCWHGRKTWKHMHFGSRVGPSPPSPGTSAGTARPFGPT